MQDSTGILQTRQLDNKFILVVGLSKDKLISNSTDKKYTAAAKTLSIADY